MGLGVPFENREGLLSGHDRHLEIEENQIRRFGQCLANCLGTVPGRDQLEALVAEEHLLKLSEHLRIVNDEYLLRHDRSPVEAFIVSLQPVPLHTELVIQFLFDGSPPLPPVIARVVSNIVDASDISRTGFGVVFVA